MPGMPFDFRWATWKTPCRPPPHWPLKRTSSLPGTFATIESLRSRPFRHPILYPNCESCNRVSLQLDPLIHGQHSECGRNFCEFFKAAGGGMNGAAAAIDAIDQNEAIADAAHGVEPMRHDQRAAIDEHLLQTVLDEPLGGRIERTGGFINDHEARFL